MPRLYRGQTCFHDQCVPSLFRLGKNQIGYLTSLLKKYEFQKLIAGSHPIIGYLQNWTIDGKYFKIDMEGLSQHYEFATSMIDVTRSKDIAMFFALCERTATSNLYEPIIDENREVVLYTVNLKVLLENNYPNFHIIGFQALPRPDLQKAYSLFIDHKDNFNIVPFVSYERFRVKRKQSEEYFQMFDGGDKLFPKNDIVSNIAQEIRESKEIDREVVETCYQRHWIPKIWANTSELVKFLNTFGYGVVEKHLEFSAEQKRTIIEKWNSKPPLNSDRVKCRFVYEPL
ncbi:MAG: FRG domain-containing protein [Syntrophus sp. (in: bacteria)]